jgi:hypothetical protein
MANKVKTDPTLAATVLRILREPGIQKINFSLNAIIVKGQDYAPVAQAIADGRIQCQVVKQFASQGELARGMSVEARYETDSNVMLFQRANYGSTASEERTILHEATHAMFDLRGSKKHNIRQISIDDESAAVLVEALYTRLCKKELMGFKMVQYGPQDEALRIADNMMAERNNFEDDTSMYVLKEEDLQMLRAAVATDWNFTRVVDKKTGTITDNTGALYIYNGVGLCKARRKGK